MGKAVKRVSDKRAAQVVFIGMYLGAIVAANLLTATFGAGVAIVNAFVLIGLDLTTRDYLHEIWRKNLWLKMGALIAFGSLISWLLNKNAGTIAIASFVAFASAAIVDTVVYQLLHRKAHLVKVNGSNIFSSLTDSVLFPTIAFGGFSWGITLAMFGAKVGGGFIWSLLLRRFHVVVNTSKLSA